jgi:hypothetical protein
MCCKLLGIEELAKPVNVWCPHCAPGRGCKIYETRPEECRTFSCGWLLDATIPEAWKPDRSKLVFFPDGESNRILIHVDPGSPDAWRHEPYHSALRQKAAQMFRSGGSVLVVVNNKATMILPTEDLFLGSVGADDKVVLTEVSGQDGPRLEAKIVRASNATPATDS